jgi:protein-L-isoaspartate(D-aspartate) O-methyltransferase
MFSRSGSDDEQVRQIMLSRVLLGRGIFDARVLAAMDRVRREAFVSAHDRVRAYADRALPIECGQTISQPFMVALVSQALELQGDEQVLEIGTGSGYQTALLAELAAQVTSIERHAELWRRAGERLHQLGYTKVLLLLGDGADGAPQFAPFDRILITAAATRYPDQLWQQLREGGILVGPFGDEQSQWLQAIRRVDGRPAAQRLVACRFVPFVFDAGYEPV